MPTMSLAQCQMVQKAAKERPHQTLYSSVIAMQELINVLIENGVITQAQLSQQQRSNFVSQMLEKKHEGEPPKEAPTKTKKRRMH